jgi:hypothetical protein
LLLKSPSNSISPSNPSKALLGVFFCTFRACATARQSHVRRTRVISFDKALNAAAEARLAALVLFGPSSALATTLLCQMTDGGVVSRYRTAVNINFKPLTVTSSAASARGGSLEYLEVLTSLCLNELHQQFHGMMWECINSNMSVQPRAEDTLEEYVGGRQSEAIGRI